jgi:hypothetical protein
LDPLDLFGGNASQQTAHATGNIEADAAGGNDSAFLGIEGRHASNGKTIAPMGVGHGVDRAHDTGQHRDIGGLRIDLVIHVADEGFVGVDNSRNPHAAGGFDAPGRFIDACEASGVHLGGSYTSTTQRADQVPPSLRATCSAV